ncbi:hypothetical protein G7046_g1872 [Stylonectria norvegica]|nr:hypothetical protein G7046_g1872 [Stylonectria norvegica]
MSQSRLFDSLQIGNIRVQHRIAMAPLTRLRASDDRVPNSLMKEYYGQRAAAPGTLIITEGNFISPNCGGFPNAPGIWREDQIEGWRTITDEIHSKGSFVFCQIFAMGRAADAEWAAKEGSPVLAPSAIPFEGGAVPRAMTIAEIHQLVLDLAEASRKAIRAGFDGVEVHVANGYLLDQFLQDVSNQRNDIYGGSIENRSRLINEVLDAVVDAIGPKRVGLRLSPWSTFQGMKMEDHVPQYTDVINKANTFHLAYLHLIESRVVGTVDVDMHESLDFAFDIWNGPILIAGGYTPQDAQQMVDKKYPDKDIVVVFGRHFISNPDLVYRVKKGLALTPYDRSTFYVFKSPTGYSDYPFSKQYVESV